MPMFSCAHLLTFNILPSDSELVGNGGETGQPIISNILGRTLSIEQSRLLHCPHGNMVTEVCLYSCCIVECNVQYTVQNNEEINDDSSCSGVQWEIGIPL